MTDFDKVKKHLKDALEEYKKDGMGNDQNTTYLSFYASGHIATWEEAIDTLIEHVNIEKKKATGNVYLDPVGIIEKRFPTKDASKDKT